MKTTVSSIINPVTTIVAFLILLTFSLFVFTVPTNAEGKKSIQLQVNGTTSDIILRNPECFTNITQCNYSIKGSFTGEPKNGIFSGSYTVLLPSAVPNEEGFCYKYRSKLLAVFDAPNISTMTVRLSGTVCDKIDPSNNQIQAITGTFKVIDGTKKYKNVRDSGAVKGIVTSDLLLKIELV